MNFDKNKAFAAIIGVVIIATLGIVGFNVLSLFGFGNGGTNPPAITGSAVANVNPVQLSGPDVIPKGAPEIYGKEIGISFDDVSPSDQQKSDKTIARLGAFDTQIKISGKEKERYIAIASQISCEYCCGVEAIIFKNGEAACGCAHSFAMRGLAKYLLTKHSSEYTDDEILSELGKWKTLFFPSQLTAKANVLQSKGIELNYINLASNKYRGIELE